MPRITAAKREEVKKRFQAFDKTKDGKLSFDEMKDLLRQGNPNIPEEELEKLFRKVDKNHDGSVDFEEFIDYIYGEPELEVAPAPEIVRERFYEFCGNDAVMDNAEFSRLCQAAGFEVGKWKKANTDNVFAKAKVRNERKIDLAGFEKACCIIAKEKQDSPAHIYEMIAAGQKELTGTQAQNNRFYNAKDESGETEAARHLRLKEKAGDHSGLGPEGDWHEVMRVFQAFDAGGSVQGLESREFKKIFDDAKLWDKKFTKNDVDVVFKKVCGNKVKSIETEQFKEALRIIAEKKGVTIQEVQSKIGALQGPDLKGTVAQANRFHDDKSLYTGMHAGSGEGGETGEQRHERLRSMGHKCGEDGRWDHVLVVYKMYDVTGNGMEGSEFVKILDDAGLIDSKMVKGVADSIFKKVCGNNKKKVDNEEFKECLRFVADHKDMTIKRVQEIVGASKGPKETNTTKAAYNRFHDGTGDAIEKPEDRHDRLRNQGHSCGPDGPWEFVEVVYTMYDGTNNGLGNAEFNKLLEDCSLLGKTLPRGTADLIFSKVAGNSKKSINKEGFYEALRCVADHMNKSIQDIQQVVGASKGPQLHGTEAQYNRFHDDKSTYTGMHAGK